MPGIGGSHSQQLRLPGVLDPLARRGPGGTVDGMKVSVAGTGVAPPPRGPLAMVRHALRVRGHRRELDEALAAGADPWSDSALMTRASQLLTPEHRGRLAASIEGLVDLAERGMPASPYLRLRRRAVRAHRHQLLALAARLRDAAPVEVAIVARLGILTWDHNSPVFEGGRPVEELCEVLDLCATALVD